MYEKLQQKDKEHLEWLINQSIYRIKTKYIKGAIEHANDRGTLEDLPIDQLMEEVLAECVDNLVYALTLYKIISKNKIVTQANWEKEFDRGMVLSDIPGVTLMNLTQDVINKDSFYELEGDLLTSIPKLKQWIKNNFIYDRPTNQNTEN